MSPGERPRRAGRGGAEKARIGQRPRRARIRLVRNQKDPVSGARHQQEPALHPGRPHRRRLGKPVGRSASTRDAKTCRRASLAERIAWEANPRAQLHQRLRPIARPRPGRQLHRPLGNGPPEPGRVAPPFEPVDSRKHPDDVAVHRGGGTPKRDALDRGGRVVADSRKREERVTIGGEPRRMLANDDLRGGVHVAGAPVVSEPGPGGADILLACPRERSDFGESTKEALVIGNHGFDPGLLEHDLAHPDRVGIARSPPREIPAMLRVPCQDGRAEAAGHGRS